MKYIVFVLFFIGCESVPNHPKIGSSEDLIFIPLSDTIQDLCYDPKFWYVYRNEKLNYIAQSNIIHPMFRNNTAQLSIRCLLDKNRLHINVRK